jgi:selenide,water dikinase
MLVSGASHTEIVLLGAGHAHVEVLRRFALRPDPAIRLTLVAREPESIYSGMLPGAIRGDYTLEQASIDLAPLAAAAGARLILAEATALELRERRVVVTGRPDLPFDILSLDVGGRPAMPEGSPEGSGVPVKPIGRFVDDWSRAEAGLTQGASVAVVGAGAGGVELVLALAHRYGAQLRLTLIASGTEPLTEAPPYARRVARVALVEAGVALVSGVTAVRQVEGRLFLSDGSFLDTAASIWATGVTGHAFLAAAGLDCDPAGCVHVDACLRSLSHDYVFAAGDCATLAETPRPKAGVWAVRSGVPLAENLRRVASGKGLLRWQPQQHALAILGLGHGRAVGWRNGMAVSGRTVWHYKDRIDRRWVNTYSRLRPRAPASEPDGGPQMFAIGAAPGRSLTDFDPGEPATVIKPPIGKLLVQCVEQITAPIDDPYVMGRVAAVHTLGDLHATAARPASVLALVTLPAGHSTQDHADLMALLQGVEAALQAEDATMIRWDARQGRGLAVSLAATGWADAGRMRRRPTLRSGDALILTKPLGGNALLNGHRLGRTRAAWLQGALQSMQRNDDPAARILTAHLARGCTTIKTRGLVGDLTAMLDACQMGAVLFPHDIPVLPGAIEVLTQGLGESPLRDDQAFTALLEEPQLSGGLLAAIPQDRTVGCLNALAAAGAPGAVIGTVEPAEPGTQAIRREPI